MTLEAGTRLGRYEVLSPLGRGGMGEVYKARDTRLGRDVAIKVLPPHLTENPELRQRFEREARTFSQLHHPHVCTVHDVGSEQGVDYLVMEYLEGETLDDRLRRGALPVAEILALRAQSVPGLAGDVAGGVGDDRGQVGAGRGARQQRRHLAAKLLVSAAALGEQAFSLAGCELERGVEQVLHLPPADGVHVLASYPLREGVVRTTPWLA